MLALHALSRRCFATASLPCRWRSTGTARTLPQERRPWAPPRPPAPRLETQIHLRRLSRYTATASATSDDAMNFLDTSNFDALKDEMALYDEQRDTVIKRSRDITKASKVAIYCLHRGETEKATAHIAEAEKIADELWAIVKENSTLRYGSYAGGLEEYAEAAVFEHFVRTGKILPSTALTRCDRDEYLGGVLDFTGELNRRVKNELALLIIR